MRPFLFLIIFCCVTLCNAQTNAVFTKQVIASDSMKVGGKVLISGSVIKPLADNSIDLGGTGGTFKSIYAYGAVMTSDIRKKKRIRPLKYGLDEVMKIDAITYRFKTDKDKKTRIGFSAQQMQNIIPEVVNVGNDPDKTLGINYMDLIPVMLNAIKEQEHKIEALEKQLIEIKKQ